MRQIAITAEAEGDLQLIYNHRLTQRGAQGPDGADALLDHLYEVMASLADYPLRGPVPPELEAIGMADWRQVSAPPYCIIYAVSAEQVMISIVADGRRDFASLLERRLLQKAARG